jgi:hypothetical protein
VTTKADQLWKVVQEVVVQVRANTKEEAIAKAERSTYDWLDWRLADLDGRAATQMDPGERL